MYDSYVILLLKSFQFEIEFYKMNGAPPPMGSKRYRVEDHTYFNVLKQNGLQSCKHSAIVFKCLIFFTKTLSKISNYKCSRKNGHSIILCYYSNVVLPSLTVARDYHFVQIGIRSCSLIPTNQRRSWGQRILSRFPTKSRLLTIYSSFI